MPTLNKDANLNQILQDTALEYTYPRWTRWGLPQQPDGDTLVSNTYWYAVKS